MTDNRPLHGPVPTHLAPDYCRSSQQASQHHRDSDITTLPPLRPLHPAPRKPFVPDNQTLNLYGDGNYNLHSTYDRCQSKTSWVAAESPPRAFGIASAIYQQSFKINSARDSTKTSYGPIQSTSLFSLPVDYNRCGNPTRKPHSDAICSLSTEHVPEPRPTASGRLGNTRDMSRLETRTSSNIVIQTHNSRGSLFVEQGDPARDNSLLNHSATYSPAPSSPLRIPSSPGDNHIGDLRVAAKLESHSYRTGFFPETDSSNTYDPMVDEDRVTANVLEGTHVSGFILEDDDSDNSLREQKITPKARVSGGGLENPELEQRENTELAVIDDGVGISNHRPWQSSSFLASLEHAARHENTTPEPHCSLNDAMPKPQVERKSQTQKGKTCQTSKAAKNDAQEKKLVTARVSHSTSSFNLMYNMAIRAAKPSIRVEAVPKQACIPGSQNPRQDARTSKT
ncbi:hypothetical protein LY78DRAFT_328032 [Colletotrichum sublineola]|nr:hypothetical protein LY78DRAFT_328032 [Colletotrichum sublineola]